MIIRSVVQTGCFFAIAVLVVGCASGGDPRVEETNFALDGAQLLADARDASASVEQLRVLEEAVDAGSMSFEDLSSLVPAAIECIEAAGFVVDRQPPEEVFPGVLHPSYVVQSKVQSADTDEMMAERQMISACESRERSFADTFYLDQPSSVEAHNSALLAETEEIRECLAARHIVLPTDPSAGELVEALNEDSELNDALAGWEPCYQGGTLLIVW